MNNSQNTISQFMSAIENHSDHDLDMLLQQLIILKTKSIASAGKANACSKDQCLAVTQGEVHG